MLYKLRIAAVLLAIGVISGASIVLVHSLTEERIDANRLEAQYEEYQDMFPDADMSQLEQEDVDHDVIDLRVKLFNSDGDQLGEVYRGHDTNNFGDISVLVGIDMDFEIAGVVITATENTPNYYQNLPLENLEGQDTSDMSYDTNTGATQSYDSVQLITDYAIEMFYENQDIDLRSPEQQALESIYGEATDDYITHFTFEDEAVNSEYRVVDENESTLGYAYALEVEDELVMIGLSSDDVIEGIATHEEADLDEIIEAFDDIIGESIDDVDVEGLSGDEAITDALGFIKDLTMDTTRIEADYLARYREVDEGFLLTGYAEGYNDMNVVEVTLSDDGEIVSVELVHSNDTEGYLEDYVYDNLDAFDGESAIDREDALDVFAGATSSGESIVNIIEAALDYYAVLGGAVELIDDEVLTSREEYLVDDETEGLLYKGEAESFGGTNVFEVAIDNDGAILSIELVETNDTDSYLDDYVYPNLSDLEGRTDLDGLSEDDTFSGATNSGESVFAMVQAVFDHYSLNPEFTPGDGDMDDEDEDETYIDRITYRDQYIEDGEVKGHLYRGEASGFGGTNVIELALDSNGEILFVDLVESEDTDEYLEDYIYPNLDAFVAQDSVDEATMLDTFAGATGSGESIYEVVQGAFSYNDEYPELGDGPEDEYHIDKVVHRGEYTDDTVEGHLYRGEASGFGGTNVIELALDSNGEILFVDLVESEDTDEYLEDYIYPNLDAFVAQDSVDEDTMLDTFAGATGSGESIYEVVKGALQYHYQYPELGDGPVDIEDATDAITSSETTDEGTKYSGAAEGFNSGGTNEVDIVINEDGVIVSAELVDYADTDDYVNDYVIPQLESLEGLTLADIYYSDAEDTFAGATATGESIYEIVIGALQTHAQGEGE